MNSTVKSTDKTATSGSPAEKKIEYVTVHLPVGHGGVMRWLRSRLKFANVGQLVYATYRLVMRGINGHAHVLLLEGTIEDWSRVESLIDDALAKSAHLTRFGRKYWRSWDEVELDGVWDQGPLGGPTEDRDCRHAAVEEILTTLPPQAYEMLKETDLIWSLSDEDVMTPTAAPIVQLSAELAAGPMTSVIAVAAYTLCRLISDADHDMAIAEIRDWGYGAEAEYLDGRIQGHEYPEYDDDLH